MKTAPCTPMLMRAKIAECGFGITSTRRQDFRTSMTTTFQSKKSKVFSAGRYRIYADGMILELQSDRLKRDDT
jgi:hypothetical protein